MRVRALRDKLAQIPGAMRDIEPSEALSGDDCGVESHRLYSPDLASESANYGGEMVCQAALDHQDSAEDGAFEPVFEWGAESDELLRRLGDAADEKIRQSVEASSGPDALGHYLSFHVRGAQWGATVKASGVAWLARHYFQGLPTDDATRVRLAFHAILQHELFHFATDVAVAQGEMSQGQAWWRPAGDMRKHRRLAYSFREERLANVWMLRAFRTALPNFCVDGKQAALKRFVELQPPGYADALGFHARDWKPELHELIYEYADLAGHDHDNLLLWGYGYDWPSQFPLWPRVDWRECAIHFVDDSARFGVPPGWLTFLSSLRAIDESDKFRKQLGKLSLSHQKRWANAKAQAMNGLTSGHDFKPWRKSGSDVWSMRIDRGFRAHLEWDRAGDRWTALEIGDHKSMGHG